MTDKHPSQNAMDKIMRGEVKQVPRWHFVVRNIVLWTLGILCILAGALTVSLIIFTFVNSAFAMRGIAYKSFWQHTIIFIPLLWIVGTLLFVGLFKFSVRHTNYGYKYPLLSILLVSFLSSVFIGIAFYFLGVSHMIDDILEMHFHTYHSVERRQARLFDNPEKGMLIGRIIQSDAESFMLVTPNGEKWRVMCGHVPQNKQHAIVDGSRFIVIGKKIDDDVFVACDVHKRGMFGINKGVQKKRMQKMNCDDACMHDHSRVLPRNIDILVQSACEHVQ